MHASKQQVRTPANELLHVVAQDGAMAGGDGGVGQVLSLAQRGEHRARIGAHEAVIVETEVRSQRLQRSVKRVVLAVVRAKGIACVHHTCSSEKLVTDHQARCMYRSNSIHMQLTS